MNICILMGSPRKKGNTAMLLQPFMEQWKKCGAEQELIWVHDKTIAPCTACRCCQNQSNWSAFGCPQQDDAQGIFSHVLSCDLLVLATPIYSWYCTPPMKAILDRLVYGMNKYYGEKKGPSLWAGKTLSLITTCGYGLAKGSDLWEEGIKRYCKHSQLQYAGMLAERDRGHTTFMDDEKTQHAEQFAQELIQHFRQLDLLD